jgi:hypothetical protein
MQIQYTIITERECLQNGKSKAHIKSKAKKSTSKKITKNKQTKIPVKKHRAKNSKATAIMVQERVAYIQRLRLHEYTGGDILKLSKVKRWGIKQDAIYAYIAQADKNIREYKKSDLPKWLKECEQKLRELYLHNFLIGDYGECRRVLDTANKILGFEKLKLQVEKTETQNININIKQEMQKPQRIEEVVTEMINNGLIPKEILEGVRN